jgi:predicted peptidase
MKNQLSYPAILLVFVSVFVSCKKESGSTGISENAANNTIETKAPVQNPISYNVNANIGGYQEALPALYDSTTKKYPLLIFIHGIGELGNGVSDLWMAGNIGTPGLIKQGKFPANFSAKGKNFSFIVVSPQFKAWPSSDDVNAMIDYAISKYRIDTDRIYVSGLSMGGGATWEYAAAYNNRVAAIAPICGASGPNDPRAQKIAQGGIAVWAFHNQDDGVVTVNNSIGYVNKINALSPAIAARITLWPTGGHDAWSKATDPNYRENGMNVYEWMLQYSR